MARKKSTEAIEVEINKTKSDLSRLQDRYEKIADKLKELQEQKRKIEGEAIMDAYLKSGKSFNEIMNFFNP